MTYTSLKFMLFVAGFALVYFLLPWRRYRWVVLLAASGFFYLCAGPRYAGYILATTLSTYLGALALQRMSTQAKQTLKEHKTTWDKTQKKAFKDSVKKRKSRILALVLLLNFGILGLLKYYNLFAGTANALLSLLGTKTRAPMLGLLLPLGISFYTFQSTGYLIDVCREKVEAERNLGKYALFVSFFPQIIQGPISIYDQLAHQLYEPHDFDFTRLKHSCELILWGLLKKLVIADRAAIAINTVTADYFSYGGTTLTFTILLYALQLYADFSGGIDITRGVARIFGIEMMDNFRQPYFATSINDYWRRWHISLGEWFKNYLFYPLATSKRFIAAGKRLKATRFGGTSFGEHTAKVLPTSIASFIVFFLVGVWHGPKMKYVAFGVWNGGVILLSAVLKPLYALAMQRLRIRPESRGFYCFQLLRTFLIVLIGYVFDVAPGMTAALRTFRLAITGQALRTGMAEIATLGLDGKAYWILAVGMLLMLTVDILHEKHGSQAVSRLLDEKPFLLRYAVLLAGVLAVVFFGVYGPGYDPADFVYMRF